MPASQIAGFFLAVALCLLSPNPATAGFDEGVAAYERGDYLAAFRDLTPVARAGDARAQVMVGIMYYNGEGTTQNHAEAAKWFRIAANQGLAVAQGLLGGLYLLGEGIAKDYTEAARWLRFAAEQGDADAQSTLGLMYAHGVGVPQDDVRAYMWLNLAAARSPSGEERRHTVELRDEVTARLSQAERARGQELARKWQPRLAATPEGESAAYAGFGTREPLPEQRRGGSNPFQAELERRIREAQQLLADLGYDPGPVDGVVGPKTRAVIWAFQADIGLPVDGQFSDELIAALRDAAAKSRRVAIQPVPVQPQPDGTAPWERYGAAAPAPIQRRLDSTGSGFAVSDDGQIVTNHHVVEDCAEVLVRPAGQEAVVGVVVAQDRGNDLALLHAPARLPAAALRKDSGIRPGDSVVAVGFPLPGLLASEANVTTGTVSALAGVGNDTRFLQMTVPVQPGNSGGPLLDLQGRVVGVVVGKLDALKVANLTGDIPQNVNFAIKASVVRSFLDASGVARGAGGVETDRWWENAPLADGPAAVGAEAKAFTVMVECWK